MVREIGSPYLQICFDGRLEKRMDEAEVERATREVGSLQVLSHYGGEYEEGLKGSQARLGKNARRKSAG